MKKFYIKKVTAGCHSASIDCNNYKRFFERNECVITDKVNEASFVLLDACMSLPDNERDNFKELDQLVKYKRTDAVLIVGGCMTPDFRARAQNKYNCPVVSFHDMKALEEILAFQKDSSDLQPDGAVETGFFHPKLGRWKALHKALIVASRIFTKIKLRGCRSFAGFVKTTYAHSSSAYLLRCCYGCPHRCSYCTIVKARGAVKSRKIEELVREAKDALSKGYTHFVLVADDLASYGIDQKEILPDLLKALLDLRRDVTVEMTNFNLMYALSYFDHFLEILEPGRITSIHNCLQSGSDRILKLMNRRYTPAEFLRSAHLILKKDPDMPFKTDVIVGFPGETEEEFQETLYMIKNVPFTRMNIFAFEDRKNVASASLSNRIPQKIKEKRKRIVRQVFYTSVLIRWLREIFLGKVNIASS